MSARHNREGDFAWVARVGWFCIALAAGLLVTKSLDALLSAVTR
jgi:hypothetical protein